MTLPLVGARLTAQDSQRYISDLSKAEQANARFVSSIRGASTTASSAFSDLNTGASRSATNVASSFTRVERSATSLAGSIGRTVGSTLTVLGTLGAAQGLTNFARSAISTRIEFERQLGNVGAIAQATEAQIAQLGDQANQLGASTAFTAIDVLGGQQFLAQAGFSVDETIAALPGLLSAASATQTDLATTSDIVSNALSGFNIQAEQTGRVSDVLVAATTSANTNLSQLGTALSFVASNSAALDVSIEETTAAIGILSNAGIQGSRAGTALRGVFNRLAAPTGEAADELDRLGINAFTADGQLRDLPDVLAEFERGLDGLNDQQRAESINTIVGTIAGTGFTALLAAGSDELRAFTEELQNSGGVAERVADQQLNNLAGDIIRVSSAYQGLQQSITRFAGPSLRTFLQDAVLPSITGTTAFFNTLADGESVLQSFSVGIADIAPDTSRLVGQFADLQSAISGVANVSVNLDGLLGLDRVRAFRFDDLFSFEVGDIQGQIRGAFDQVDINVGEFVTFTSGDEGARLDINDVITGTYDTASAFGTIRISDIVTGSLDLSTGEGSITLGENTKFEFDLGALNRQIQAELTSIQNSILGDPGGFQGGTFVPPTPGITQNIQSQFSEIQTELSGLTFDQVVSDGLLAAAGAISTINQALSDIDFSNFDVLTTIGDSLSTLDTALAGATGDGSNISNFVVTVNESLSSLATTIDSLDAESIGGTFTGAIESVLGIFTTLNTIDDLALGGIAGSLGDVTTSILNFATDFTAGLDSEALGTAAADSASQFIGSFSAVISEPDIPEIAGAAAGLVGAIGASIRTALTSGEFETVGAEFGGLATDLIGQISATLSDPEFAEDLGTGFSDILVGITTGLSDALGGFGDELEGSESNLNASVRTFASNFVSAISTSLQDADYGSIASALITGIGRSLSGGVTQLLGEEAEEQVAAQAEAISGVIRPGDPDFVSSRDRDREAIGDFFRGIGESIGLVEPEVEAAGAATQGFADATSTATATITTNIATLNAAAATPLVLAPGGAQVPFAPGETAAPAPLVFAPPQQTQTLENVAIPVQFQDLQSSAASADAAVSGLVGTLNSIQAIPAVDDSLPQARRTGLGDETGFDEASVTSSINETIAAQLNFGDIGTEVTASISGAIESAIPSEPIIDSESVNNAVLAAAQEAIPASEIPEFPSWPEVVDFNPPRLPRFPGWKEALGFEPPPIPEFPGWGAFIEFDIPSIPSFPPWSSLVGGVDIGSLIPPFPGWAALVGGGGGGSTGGSAGGGGNAVFSASFDGVPAAAVPVVASGFDVRAASAEPSVDESFLGSKIAQGFATEFAIPSFVGWDEVFQGGNIEIPPFPGWAELVGELDNVNLIIQRTENITEVTIEQEEERDIGVGPITPIPIGDLTPFTASSFGSPALDNANARIEQSSTIVNNTTQHFNLTTNSLRSTEDVESDFAMMERFSNV